MKSGQSILGNFGSVTITNQRLMVIIVTGGDALSDVMSNVSKSDCCDAEQEDLPSPNNKAKDKDGSEKPSRPSLGKSGEDIYISDSF